MPTPPAERPTPPRRAKRLTSTTDSTIEGEPAPRLPHEHDESSDSQQSAPRDVMRQAHDDVQRGLVDTGRSAPMNKTYRRVKEATPPAAKRRPPK